METSFQSFEPSSLLPELMGLLAGVDKSDHFPAEVPDTPGPGIASVLIGEAHRSYYHRLCDTLATCL